MPKIHPISAIQYSVPEDGDISALIAPPYDVLDEAGKEWLLRHNPHNIVSIDLPHLPAKTVGPDKTYEAAGAELQAWLDRGVLERSRHARIFVYRQTFTMGGPTHERLGLIANLQIQPFANDPGVTESQIYAHEQTFSEPKEDRLKLTKATRTQLSPIFGIYSDADREISEKLRQVAATSPPALRGTTSHDTVRHEIWDAADHIEPLTTILSNKNVYIADGHHRYNTALNYQRHLIEAQGPLSPDHPANFCMFVLVAMQDPGMVVRPTHRVLGNMDAFEFEALTAAAAGHLQIDPFNGDLPALEAALDSAGDHAFGLCHMSCGRRTLAVATTVQADPLATSHAGQSEAWRQLDVAILQHLVVEQICEPNFCAASSHVTWRFPHELEALNSWTKSDDFQLGIVMQATPLDAVRRVSEAGELMPQKSTFFYPKVATGFLLNPLS